MRASGSCLVEEWNLLAEETVEPMRTFFKVGKRLPSFLETRRDYEDKTQLANRISQSNLDGHQ